MIEVTFVHQLDGNEVIRLYTDLETAHHEILSVLIDTDGRLWPIKAAKILHIAPDDTSVEEELELKIDFTAYIGELPRPCRKPRSPAEVYQLMRDCPDDTSVMASAKLPDKFT